MKVLFARNERIFNLLRKFQILRCGESSSTRHRKEICVAKRTFELKLCWRTFSTIFWTLQIKLSFTLSEVPIYRRDFARSKFKSQLSRASEKVSGELKVWKFFHQSEQIFQPFKLGWKNLAFKTLIYFKTFQTCKSSKLSKLSKYSKL